jgi:hypothetical protein
MRIKGYPSIKAELESLNAQMGNDEYSSDEKQFIEGARIALKWILEWNGPKRDKRPSVIAMEMATNRQAR